MGTSASRRFKQNVPLLWMFIPGAIFYLLIKYTPMAGLVIAFKDYNLHDGIVRSPWVGLDNFRLIFSNALTTDIILNTLWLSLLRLVVGFPFPILLALLLNEVRKTWFKRSIQTMVFLPHFFSWVIVGGIVLTLFSQEAGSLNLLLERWFGYTHPFMYDVPSWVTIYLGSGIWKEAGFSAIIYLAALAAIDPVLYEAAAIDGASKWRQIWHITLPGVSTVVAMMLILSMGSIMEVSFDQIYILGNPVVSSISEVISTWVYQLGLQGAQFSLTTAMGLFESLVGLLLILTANQIARRMGKELW
ncbi:protein lplB [Paenibacillus sp. MY03]|uniref:ABC transporter permease n=1 Tax=Paenibacillus sp. MY03 TaxID=302980 RepID=UPI000B3CCCDA|nr:ABC transporter permease subunit [Paenibacillus sp. MY03]OUS74764.1 protein lplB [Paenibacillus sp. MY03]